MVPSNTFPLVLLAAASAHACSDFILRHRVTSFGQAVSTRTMDWGALDPEFELQSFARGHKIWVDLVPKGCPDCPLPNVKATYGGVFINGLHVEVALDGMNEAGLSVATLAHRIGKYPLYTPADTCPVMPVYSMPAHILGTCADVECARREIERWQIIDADHPAMDILGGTMGLHWVIHNANGRTINVEFVPNSANASAPECFKRNVSTLPEAGARICVYDNKPGVFTNAPFWEQQIEQANLRLNVTKISDVADAPRSVLKKAQTEAGSFESPDRFVHLVVLQETAMRAGNRWLNFTGTPFSSSTNKTPSFVNPDRNVDAVAEAQLMIGRVSRAMGGYDFDVYRGATWWTVVRDHTTRSYYYRLTASPNLIEIDLADLALTDNSLPRPSVPMNRGMNAPFASKGHYSLLAQSTPTPGADVSSTPSAVEWVDLALLVATLLLGVGMVWYVRKNAKNVYADNAGCDSIQSTRRFESKQ